jgi:pyruvyltransferase
VKRIKAVRGKLTKDALDKMGLDCPEVYGDPALLLPMVYNPKIEKKHKIGIVPHYVDKGHAILKALIQEEGALFIDIEAGKNWKKFIRQVKSCDMILSSSLHGIIVAEAYGIQNAWVRFSDNVLGDGYKFRDYYSSVHKEHVEPLDLNEGYKISEIEEKIQQWRPIGWDAKVLLSSYPFQHCVRPQYLNVS